MTHEEVLNEILAHTCATYSGPNGYRRYVLDGHCVEFIIEAQLTSAEDSEDITYDIITIRKESI